MRTLIIKYIYIIMLYNYIYVCMYCDMILPLCACLGPGGNFCHYARMCSRYSCGLDATFQGRIITISHNAIFDDLRHFYILCVFLCLCCEVGYIGQIRKAGIRKNATGTVAPKIEHNRTLCEIEPKSAMDFRRKSHRNFI